MKDGGPACPIYCSGDDGPNFNNEDADSGISVRDYFAIRILAARLVAHPKPEGTSWNEYADLSSHLAYQFADKMLEARK